MAEAFVKTFKRDYVYVNDLSTAAAVIAQVSGWMAGYNEFHPHRGLMMKSPLEFRRNGQSVASFQPKPSENNASPFPNAMPY